MTTNMNVLWLAVVATYMVQMRFFARIVGRDQSINEATQEIQEGHVKPGFTVHLAILYLASWYFLIPFSNYIWSHNALDTPAPVQESGSSASFNEGTELDDMSVPVPVLRAAPSGFAHHVRYFMKILAMSFFLAIVVVTYTLGLHLSPEFDITLIQNCAFFEITTLLYGVCNVSRNKHVFRNFLIMMLAVLSILVVSYTNATCMLLSGKLSVNKETKEVNDPWLFDRLKAGLITGLGSLAIGPFAVWCNQWFEQRHRVEKIAANRRNMFWIPTVSICLLLPFVKTQQLPEVWDAYYSSPKFWMHLVGALVFGVWPNFVAVVKLNALYPNEFITTANLGVIIVTGLFEWICQSGQTVIVRWEVISYLFLTLCTIFLYFSLRGPVKA
ncbi:hypothetical protein DAKH74_046320 [Maudiozyma humilis]|uniref:Uncharacterized protein n=1 Tax=Maudiozyma humilis TaxID=51915 RepID=A0AAV5S4P6_MAUHU|nr:hypothetical protein DAKH74_046320 [Kazachstania humilis]